MIISLKFQILRLMTNKYWASKNNIILQIYDKILKKIINFYCHIFKKHQI